MNEIADILNEENIFIMIIGGTASGKSFCYKNNLSLFPLIDIDEYTFKLSNGDWELARKMVGKAIKMVEEDLFKMFNKRQSVVNTGTGASLAGVMKKITKAKECNMKTAIILVDVPLEVALQRNKERSLKGERNLIPDYKVERTNIQARENFSEFIKHTDYKIILKD